MRRSFDLYVNCAGAPDRGSIAAGGTQTRHIDFWVVAEHRRANTPRSRRIFGGHRARNRGAASTFTRHGGDRILKYGRARPGAARRSNLTSPQVERHSITLPSGRARSRMASQYPGSRPTSTISTSSPRTSSSTGLVRLCGSNLFGDISRTSARCTGTIAIAPSATSTRAQFPSVFDRCHGSAPDIAGRTSRTHRQIWWAVMLEHLGHKDAGEAIVRAIERSDRGPRTRDIAA